MWSWVARDVSGCARSSNSEAGRVSSASLSQKQAHLVATDYVDAMVEFDARTNPGTEELSNVEFATASVDTLAVRRKKRSTPSSPPAVASSRAERPGALPGIKRVLRPREPHTRLAAYCHAETAVSALVARSR